MALFGGALLSIACSSPEHGTDVLPTDPACANGIQDGDETAVDCGGRCGGCGSSGAPGPNDASGSSGTLPDGGPATGINGVRDGAETDVDCGGPEAPKCGLGKACEVDTDCDVACNYAKKCIGEPSCKPHLGGDTCGQGEVGEPGVQHESCCRSLEVPGYVDPSQPGKKVYLDKYEITAGRVRAFVESMALQHGGNPDVKSWIAANRPAIWDPAWDAFMPSDWEGGSIVIARRLLGDPRPEDNGWGTNPEPGVILPPATDEPRRLGVNYQFGSEVYVDLHGMNCGTFPNSYGFPTYYYPADLLALSNQLPRASGQSWTGVPVGAKELLDVKAMNCITNAMLAAFCAWDGGQLATDEVLDYVTQTPAKLGNVSGCGTQYDNHGELLKNIFDRTVQTGGVCAPAAAVNATFDAGDVLPIEGSPLNAHNYEFPNTGYPSHDKSWQVSAPGRASTAPAAQSKAIDAIRIAPNDEPWMDLHGNLNEAALDMDGAKFTGRFALKYRGIGYGSARSDLNVKLMKGETIVRIQRPEAKAAYTGGRCMRFR